MTFFTTTIYVDFGDTEAEVPAEFSVDAEWTRRNRSGFRTIDYINSFTLTSWAGGKTRAELVQLIGEEAVDSIEGEACDDWFSSAEADDADEYADYLYERERDRKLDG